MNTPLTLEQALQMAVAHHQAGHLPQAEALYRQILAVQPNHPDALHLLGVLASQVGQPAAAVELIAKAIAVQPGQAAYHTNLGEAYRALGQLDDAIAEYRIALALAPNIPETHNNLGIALFGKGRMEEAIASYERAITLRPGYAEAHSNLGNAWAQSGQWAKAIVSCQQALAINPAFAEAHHNLGIALKGSGQSEAAIASFERALALRPDYVEALNNLGAAFYDKGRFDDAIACYQRALTIQPDSFDACNNLGVIFYDTGRLDDAMAYYQRALVLQSASPNAHMNLGIALTASGQVDQAIASCRQAVALEPDSPYTHNSLGNALFHAGRIASAIESYRQAVQFPPNDAQVYSSLVYALHFDPTITAQNLYAEHQEWNQRFAVPLRSAIGPHANDPDPNKRLKIGYVSPDFRTHVCGLFLLPLFASHDHTQFEVYCYASVRQPDDVTNRLKQGADVWRDVLGLSDDQMAQQIRQDKIDLLVDLTMHMTNSRLPVFAGKPAPVQVTYLAYCSTTGLDTMDYRLTDPFIDPPGSDDSCYSETSIQLPDTYWCYPPPAGAPDVAPQPALAAGHITFGCLNNFSKVNAQVLAIWARLLQAVPDAHLVLHAHSGSHREQTRLWLETEGIHPERVHFVGNMPMPEYFTNHGQTDIALDPFPYAGGTTTCDALWMGVPVVTLAGKTAVGRGGVSILSNIGLPELVTHSEDDYVRIAVELASDLPRLAELRATMRERMLASPLMDGPRFARSIEAAYRKMWTNWCRGK